MKTLFIVLSIVSAFLFRASGATVAWDMIELTSGEFSGTGADRVWHGTFSTNGSHDGRARAGIGRPCALGGAPAPAPETSRPLTAAFPRR